MVAAFCYPMGYKAALAKGPEQSVKMSRLLFCVGMDEDSTSLMVYLLTQSTCQSIAVAGGTFTEYVKIDLSHGVIRCQIRFAISRNVP
jgi:hypothetical protein